MLYKNEIAQSLHHLLSEEFQLTELDLNQILNLIEVPKDQTMGDLAFPCFLLSKSFKKSPPAVASVLEPLLSSRLNSEYFSTVKATGPYLNFSILKSHLASTLIPQVLKGDFLAPEFNRSDRVMIEFSQPNTHKEFHVGHMRNAALGDSLVRIFKWAGYDVLSVNYIGDVGTHIAKCLWYYRDYYKGETPSENLGEFLGKMYVKANELLEFDRLSLIPNTAVKFAKVNHIQPHPSNPKWNIVTITEGQTEKTVVCGGSGYVVNDLAAYLPVGSKWKGRDIGVNDMQGVPSEGMLLSFSELKVDGPKDKKQIFTIEAFLKHAPSAQKQQFEPQLKNINAGDFLANVFALNPKKIEKSNVVDEILFRESAVSKVLQDLESGERQITELWKKTRQWSLDEFEKIYSWLDIHFDHFFYESGVADSGKEIIYKALEEGLLVRSEGAVGADLTAYKLPFFLLLKSDGTGLYSTKDIALAREKFENFKIDRSIYVVDTSQSLHFQQVFKTLELFGFQQASKCYHLAYGMVEGPEGKMSSRKGNIILFSALKNNLTEKITQDFLEKYRGQWPDQEIEDTAQKIAVSTIKYGMLNQDNNKNIIFDMNEWTAKTGNTGPYLMYAYARTQSILSEAGKLNEDFGQYNWASLTHEKEHSLLTHLMKFQDYAQKACEKYEPQNLCIYLYQLSKEFSQFYGNCSVIKAETNDLKQARLALVVSTGKVLKKGLELLGINTAQRM
ncbi:MAG: arginine--tRNA ligase [Bdellovibrionales bacterium]|nr:arginine--tRNA ligase [Bdellovibrionales bacterium]